MSPIRDIAVVNGLRLYYEIHGEGPWLVLIEGLGVATWLWEKQIPEFSRHFRVLAYDNRGTGKSDKPPGPYTVGEMAEDLAGLMEVLQIPRAHVLGISLGGYIAQEFALGYPERVDRLVLVATGHGGADQVPIPPETVQQILEPGDGSRESVRRKLALAFSGAFLNSPEIEHQIDLRLADPQPREAFLAQAQAGATFDRSADVHRIQAPCLIMGATGDKIVPVANVSLLAQKIPHSRAVIYEGFGHQFLIENASQFNRDVIRFLT